MSEPTITEEQAAAFDLIMRKAQRRQDEALVAAWTAVREGIARWAGGPDKVFRVGSFFGRAEAVEA